MLRRLATFFQHRWMDESDTRRAIAPAALKRLTHRVAASESRHTGEIRIFVEASLPLSYLWRHVWHKTDMETLARQRAVTVFGKLRVWDTQLNNGVLIYLLLAERKIELMADRGVNGVVAQREWQQLLKSMSAEFSANRFEEGLTLALDEVSSRLAQHFPLPPGAERRNELPDAPALG
jgi:uncharacterized membrane protein